MNKNNLIKHFNFLDLNFNFLEFEYQLPINYDRRYDIEKVNLENDEVLFIKEKRKGSLESFVSQAEFISKKLKAPYVLVFSQMSEAERFNLIKAKIPFLDYLGNMFLPMLGLSLKKEVEKIVIHKFTPSEQAIMIALLFNKGNEINIDNLSELTKVSVPTIYRSFKKFVDNDLLVKSHNNYTLKDAKTNILQKSFKYFVNPIDKVLYLKALSELTETNNTLFFDSGLKALSKFTDLHDLSETKAISLNDFNKKIKPKEFSFYEKNILNLDRLEIWKYYPNIMHNKDTVDPISLYLSLEDSDDPRIQIEREKLLDQIYLEMEMIN